MPIDAGMLKDVLEGLKGRIGADAVFLVDVNGFLLGGTDVKEKFDLDGIASLSAGNYLSGLELAKLFRIKDYQSFFLGSGEKVDYFQIGGEGLFLAILQPRLAPLAEVVEESKTALVKIHKMYQQARRESSGIDVVISDRRTYLPPQHPAARFAQELEPSEQLRCSFCQKTGDQAKKIVKGPKAMICDECIKVISEVLFIDLL